MPDERYIVAKDLATKYTPAELLEILRNDDDFEYRDDILLSPFSIGPEDYFSGSTRYPQ